MTEQDRQQYIKKAEAAIAAAYDNALEVGCMEHGGFEVLAEAAVDAILGVDERSTN